VRQSRIVFQSGSKAVLWEASKRVKANNEQQASMEQST